MFDLNTLRLIAMVSFIGFVFMAVMLWRLVPQERSMKYWAMSALLIAVGLFLLGLRGHIYPFISIVIANTLIMLGVGYMYVGSRLLLHASHGRPWPWYAAGLTFLICMFTPGIPERVSATSVLDAGFFLACSILFWTKGEEQFKTTKRIAVLIFAIGAVLFIYRALNPPLPLHASSITTAMKLLDVAPYLYALLLSIWIPLTLMFIVSTRLQYQRSDAVIRAKQAFNELEDSEFRWKFAIEGSGDGLWDWDVEHEKVFYSKRWKELLGYSEREVGDGLNEWSERVHPDDKAGAMAAVENHFDGKTSSYLYEHRLLCKNGDYKWILTRGLAVSRDSAGRPLRVIGTHTDITERKLMEEQIRHQALYDGLTQLPNRYLFEDRLRQAMAKSKRTGCYGALMFLDMDNFKPLNDKHGHAVGDLLLIEVAARLKSCVREADTVARIGGDEFVIKLDQLNMNKELSQKEALATAEKIRLSLAEPYLLKVNAGKEGESTVVHRCTASVGLVLFVGTEASYEEIIKWADDAMYRAKDTGRNQVKVYEINGDEMKTVH